ncbi:MAG: hypothetical protein ABI716_01345 [Candidatus Saccharibacteria bacterium]
MVAGAWLFRQQTPAVVPATAGRSVATPTTSNSDRSNSPVSASLPADFPLSVPLPNGNITGVSTSQGRWSIGYTLPGDYFTVMNDLRRLYTADGFQDLNASDKIPFGLENSHYRLQLAGFSHDHSNSTTDVTIVVMSR